MHPGFSTFLGGFDVVAVGVIVGIVGGSCVVFAAATGGVGEEELMVVVYGGGGRSGDGSGGDLDHHFVVIGLGFWMWVHLFFEFGIGSLK